MKTRIALLLAASMIGFGAQAELQTTVQTQSFVGSAGNTSTSEAIDPFTFDYFDTELGTLTGVYVSYDIAILGGFIGADNQTNSEVQGDMEIGGGAFLEAVNVPFMDDNYASLFQTVSGQRYETFTLDADPTLSVGGNGPDTFTINGYDYTGGIDFTAVNTAFLNNFQHDGSFDVNFRSYSVLNVDAPGARGFFDSPDMEISMSMYYTYEEPIPDVPAEANDVTSPLAAGALGMLLMGAGAGRRRMK